MKKSLLFICLTLISVAGFSQITSWNVKAGLNSSNLYGKDTDGSDAKLGFKIGAGCEYAFTESFSLQPSLVLESKGCKLGDVKANAIYLELPVMAAYRFHLSETTKLVLNAGPYVAYGIGGKTAGVKTFDIEGVRRFDLGAGVGVAVELGQIVLGLESQVGAISINKDSSAKNISSALTVGYKF